MPGFIRELACFVDFDLVQKQLRWNQWSLWVLITAAAMLFSAIPVYASLFLVPKWRRMFGQPPIAASRERPMVKRRGR